MISNNSNTTNTSEYRDYLQKKQSPDQSQDNLQDNSLASMSTSTKKDTTSKEDISCSLPKSWVYSENFFKRAFGILGHFIVAYMILLIIAGAIGFVFKAIIT